MGVVKRTHKKSREAQQSATQFGRVYSFMQWAHYEDRKHLRRRFKSLRAELIRKIKEEKQL